MPQSNNVRVNEINNHSEHAAERAGASHDKKTHLSPQESERQSEEHARQQHDASAAKEKPAAKK